MLMTPVLLRIATVSAARLGKSVESNKGACNASRQFLLPHNICVHLTFMIAQSPKYILFSPAVNCVPRLIISARQYENEMESQLPQFMRAPGSFQPPGPASGAHLSDMSARLVKAAKFP